jgi:hypothetical protein
MWRPFVKALSVLSVLMMSIPVYASQCDLEQMPSDTIIRIPVDIEVPAKSVILMLNAFKNGSPHLFDQAVPRGKTSSKRIIHYPNSNFGDLAADIESEKICHLQFEPSSYSSQMRGVLKFELDHWEEFKGSGWNYLVEKDGYIHRTAYYRLVPKSVRLNTRVVNVGLYCIFIDTIQDTWICKNRSKSFVSEGILSSFRELRNQLTCERSFLEESIKNNTIGPSPGSIEEVLRPFSR